MLRMLLSVLLTLGLAQSQSDRGATPASSSLKRAYEIADAYDVYAAVLPKDWMLYGKPAKQLIVQQETYPAKMCLEPEPESGKLIGEAIEDYKKQNERMWFLQRKFKTDKPCCHQKHSWERTRADGRCPRSLTRAATFCYLRSASIHREPSPSFGWSNVAAACVVRANSTYFKRRRMNGQPLKWRGLFCSIAF